MTEKTWITRSADETVAVGAEIAASLKPPVLLTLRGGLGAGKTTLVKGIVQALGAADADEVTSPTFTLLHEYESDSGISLYHLDVYRLESERQLDTVGWQELLRKSAIVLIEWGEKFPMIVERADGEIAIEGAADNRTIALRMK